MTEQQKSVESYQLQVDQVKADLDSLKKETSNEIIKSRTEALEQNVNKVKEEIKKELEVLKGSTDAASTEKAKQLEEMLTLLETSIAELTMLKSSVTIVSNTSEDISMKNLEETKEEEEKDGESKDRNWIQRQRDRVTSKEEWKTNTLANVARVAGGIGVVALGVRGIKKLFGIGKKKKETAEGEESTEKKGFRKTGLGKFLKRIGIGTGAYYIAHGLYTGKRGLSDFFDWNKRNETDPETLKSQYEKNIDAGLKPKYDKFAGMVDEYRKKMGNTDSLGVLEDKKNNKIKIPRGAIPAAMDNAYDNVGEMLDTNGDILYKRARVGGKLRGLVTSLGGKVVGGLFRGAVGLINGLTGDMFNSDGTPNEKFKEWAEKEDLTRDEQVANLMQKYSIVTTYLNDKKKQLTRKYTIDQLKTEQGIVNPTEEQIEDYELNKDLVEMKVERDFLSKKIASLDPGLSALDALENAGVFDDSVSVETQAVLDEVKNMRKEIIPDETIWGKVKASPDINKDEPLRTELNGISTRFDKHLKEGILNRNILEGIANARGILNLDELGNAKEDDLEEAIEKLGFGDEVKRFALENNYFYTKLQSKPLTKADIENFEQTINSYFSLLQEVMLDVQMQQESEEGFGWDRMKTRFLGRLYMLVLTPTGWIIMATGFVNSRWMKWFPNAKKTPVKRAYDNAFKPVKFLFRQPMRKVGLPSVLGNKYLKNISYGNTDAGYKAFFKDFESGKIPYDDACWIYEKKLKQQGNVWPKANNSDIFESLLKEKRGFSGDQIQMLQKYFNNKNVRSILTKNPSVKMSELANKLKGFDDELSKLPAGKGQEFCEQLFKKAKFTTLADLDNLTKNISKIDVSLIDDINDDTVIRKMIKELGENISTLKTADAINKKMVDLKKVVDLLDDASVKKINALIDVDLKKTKSILNAMGNGPSSSRIRRKYYQNTVESLEIFKSNTKKITKGELNAILKLSNNGFDVSNLAKLYSMSKVNVKGVELIQEALKKGDIQEIKKALETASETQDFIKNIAKSDIEAMIKSLDNVGRTLVKSGDYIATVFKSATKLFTSLA